MPNQVQVLLTRPLPQSERFADQLKLALGDRIRVVISPILTIRPINSPVSLDGVSAVILSSENGARVLAEMMDVGGRLAYCVGDRTAHVAHGFGMRAMSANGDANDLIAMIKEHHQAGQLLHVHGAVSQGDIAANLNANGINTRSEVIYEQVETSLSNQARALLQGDEPVILPLFSPRSAALVGKAADTARAPLALASLSPAVRAAWVGPKPVASLIADQPNARALCDIVEALAGALPT